MIYTRFDIQYHNYDEHGHLMAGDRGFNTCRICGVLQPYIFMLHDDLWKVIADHLSDLYCLKCCENKLGRLLTPEDFKPGVPCNVILLADGLDPVNKYSSPYWRENLEWELKSAGAIP